MFKVPDWVILGIIFIALFIAFFYLLTFFETRKKERIIKLKNFLPVTFLVPAYNASNCIERTIKSILQLDYPRNKVKIFIINDGSTDNTVEIIKKLMKKHKQIKLFTKEREGKAVALNYGIERVETELTATLDADTVLERDIMEKIVPFFYKEDMIAVTSRLVPLNTKGFLVRMQSVEYALTSFFRSLLSNINALPIAPAFTVYQTSFFRKHGGFDKDNLTEDFEMALRIHHHGYNIIYVLDSYARTIVPSKFTDLQRQRVRWGYGTLYNLRKYKHMFSPRYDDLGMFLLPMLLVGILLIILTILLAIYNISIGLSEGIRHIMLGWTPTFKLTLFDILVTFSDPRVVLGIFSVAISFLFLYIIKKEADIKLNFFEYIVYVLTYVWLLAYFYIVSLIRFFSKKPSW